MGRPPARRAALLLAAATTLLLIAVAAPAPAAAAAAGAAKKKKAKPGAAEGPAKAPPTMNPYADLPYAGCEGGFCPAADPAAEHALYRAAAAGDVAGVSRLLAPGGGVNATRNVVPDGDGFVRVVDAALWAAAKHGRLEALKAILDTGYKGDFEDGHVVDLAAANGDTATLAELISRGFAMGSSALAYAAKHHNVEMMKALLQAVKDKAKGREPDLKSAMQAACQAGNETVLRLLVEEGAFKEMIHPVSKRPAVHDWRGDYVAEAVRTGHPIVLEMLFASGYTITWQNAQDLIKLAAAVGNADTLRHLLAQPTVQDDPDELEESVRNALKVAAEEGREAVVELVLGDHAQLAKAACPAALIKATTYGHAAVAAQLRRACNVSEASAKLQAAGWLGALFNAARGGHIAVARLLMASEDAGAMLGKLYASQKPRKDGPPIPPNPEKDPLAVAAARGHMATVELLAPQRALCAPCAAQAAARAGHADVVTHLLAGPAARLLEAQENGVQEALRAVAGAMEGGHWAVVRALLVNHESDKVGPYFLPAISGAGKLGDLDQMLQIIDEVGCHDAPYLASQLSSAIVSAALSGHAEMVVAVERVRDAFDAGRPLAGTRGGAAAAAGEGGADAGHGDKTEL